MKNYLDSLNLKPFEKRLVVVVMVIMFIVINMWFVVPHFSDWGRAQFRMDKARRTLMAFETEVRQIPVYQARVRELQSENSAVPIEEQNLHFNNTREAVAAQAGVTIGTASRITTRTNQFFLELTQTVTLLCKEPQLVTFLHSLGSGNSLIRVRDLSLRPDPPRFQLSANVKLAASYAKRQPTRALTNTLTRPRPVEVRQPRTVTSATAPASAGNTAGKRATPVTSTQK